MRSNKIALINNRKILIKITIVLPSSHHILNIKLKLPRSQVHVTSPIMFLQLFSRTGQFIHLPMALPQPVVNLFGQCHSDSRCNKRIIIVNQSRRICHFLTLWPQLLSRFGNRWRFASTVTWCPLLAHCRIFWKNTFSSQWLCDVVHDVDNVDMPYDESWSSRFDNFLIRDMFRKNQCISPAIFETFLA